MIKSSLAFEPQAAIQNNGLAQWQTAMRTTNVRQQGMMRYDMNERTAGPMPSFGGMMDQNTLLDAQMSNAYTPSSQNALQGGRPDIAYQATKDDGFEFGDVIDMVNPLQHLPVIGTLYRKFTGDTMKGFSEIIGGAIFGGPVGAVSSTVNVIVKDRTGKDMAENVLSLANINISPEESTPELIYLEPQEQELPGTTLALANLPLTRDGKRNFAASALPATSLRLNA